jgi:transglutaminase-like putative cysteine protease
MTASKTAGVGVVLAAAVAALAFAPVFSVPALIMPVLAVLIPVLAIDQLVLARSPLEPARAPLALVAGLVTGVAVLAGTGGGLGPVLTGIANGWLRTLESTFPARPDAELLAFVPVLALLAGVLGIEWLRRGLPALAVCVPSFVVVVIAQLYQPASGWAAVALTLGYGLAVALVFVGERAAPVRLLAQGARHAMVLVLPLAVATLVGTSALALPGFLSVSSWSLHDRFEIVRVPDGAANPLTEIGGRLARPDQLVFTAETTAPVDRWPLLVLDRFDGVSWSGGGQYRPFGTHLPGDDRVTTGTETHDAVITLAEGLDGPWLPTQYRTAGVDGLRTAVEPATGSVIRLGEPQQEFRLLWRAPQFTPEQLAASPIDTTASALRLTQVPAGIVTLTDQVLGNGSVSFATALALEQWFRTNYQLASPTEAPTGSGVSQLLHFLNTSKRGTSEQFAAAYTLMARTAGLPVRLVVGFHQPTEVDAEGRFLVRNRDAYAWPEIAVAGLGWVALDPTPAAATTAAPATGAASATEKVRQQLPRSGAIRPPEPPPSVTVEPDDAPGDGHPALLVGSLVLALLLAGLLGIPLAKHFRRFLRKQAPPRRAVVGAWLQARDRLRDHGVRYQPGMSVRDLRTPAEAVLNGAGQELDRLAHCVDHALWSGTQPDRGVAAEAWAATRTIERALARRPVIARARALLDARTLGGVK